MQGGHAATSATAGFLGRFFQQYGTGLSERARLQLLATTIFGFIILKALTSYGYQALSAWFNGQMIHTLRCALFRQLLNVGYASSLARNPASC